MRGTPLRDEKAVSPVIATIIIVAVAIVMSIAVAYWMLGLAGTFTRYEKIEFVAAYVNRTTTINNNEYYEVVVKVRNTGSSDATINLLLVNGKIDKGVKVDVNASDNID
ncbi:MAG: archaellin/type IV pilin N-terminal domain-containing protein, partial [Desulfurococcaceae archaeon]